MKKRTRNVIIAAAVVVLLAAGLLLWWFLRGGKTAQTGTDVYVDSVGMLTGVSLGTDSRYSGEVEAEQTFDVSLDSSKKVAEIYVQEGQEVQAGDPLFAYDAEELNLALQQARLELEGIQNEINVYNGQVADWQKRPDKTSQEYLLGLQDLQLKVREAEYRLSTKQFEIEQTQKSIDNAVVTSEIAGTVKSIHPEGSNAYGEAQPFISVLSNGDYRIRCKVSELTVSNVYEGMPVLVLSRVNPEDTWKGEVERIDRENIAGNTDVGVSYGTEDTMTPAANYYFYVKLNEYDGLMLGQHVYVEESYENEGHKDGLWLADCYITIEDDSAWVWAEDADGRMEKRSVTLGEHDADLGAYEITDGLTAEDFIAFPSEDVEEGAKALHFSDSLGNGGVSA